MAPDTTIPRSRRALLSAAVAATAVTVVEAVARPLPVSAGTDGDLVLGAFNVNPATTTVLSGPNGGSGSTGITILHVQTGGLDASALVGVGSTGSGVWGHAASGGIGVKGTSGVGIGVRGEGGGTGTVGVSGWSPGGTGTVGSSATGTGVDGVSTSGIGVHGASESSAGVSGHATTGVGVHGLGGDGTGVLAESTSGTALNVIGKTHFNRSGKATVPAGHRSVDVTVPGGLGGTPLCFANIRIYRSGVAVAAVRPNWPSSGKIRIYLTKVMTSSTSVSWMVMD